MAASYREARQYERTMIRERGVLVRGELTISGLVTRLSGGGIFFETSDVTLARGDEVLARFRLPCFEDPLVVKGEIRWVARPAESVDSPGLGIAFRDLDARQRQAIVEWVAERGSVGTSIDELVTEGNADLARAKSLLDDKDLASLSLAELRARVRTRIE